MLITLALIQACHALSQLNIAALHSQSHPAALVDSQLSRWKAVSSFCLLCATEDDSNIVKGGRMRTWNPFALVFQFLHSTHTFLTVDHWRLILPI
jgi:hypothetical protein